MGLEESPGLLPVFGVWIDEDLKLDLIGEGP